MRRRDCTSLLLAACLLGCGHPPRKKVIVLAVDGMDPGFVERHWSDLPNLSLLRNRGGYAHLATTNPPQSPVAWSTFITGLDPAEHGIFDFVQRDPDTQEPYLSTTSTREPRFRLPLGPWELPSRARIVSLRRGRAFWEALADRSIPVTVLRLPSNYPPSPAGQELSGMGTPDLRGTEGMFTLFTSDPLETNRTVAGGQIRRIDLTHGRSDLAIEGPPNTLRRDRASTSAHFSVDVDPERPYARLATGSELLILKEGEWSDWLTADFALIPHVISVHGMFRLFLKRVHPTLEIYASPVNVDPAQPALPISAPASYARAVASRIGRWSTLGIPEDTAALRANVFSLPQFLMQSRLVLRDELRLLDDALGHFGGGLLICYFSVIDQNSHMLWGIHDAELLEFYRAVDGAVGQVLRRERDAEVVVLSDHGFAAFDRAVHLNRWLADHDFGGKAYALGLNGLYLRDRSVMGQLRAMLLDFHDPQNGRPVIRSVSETNGGRSAPDMIVGYNAGYRASWETASGDAPAREIEDNDDTWSADHCIDPALVPGVLFATVPLRAAHPELKDLPVSLLSVWGLPPINGMKGHPVF